MTQAKSAATNWARANKLAELAGIAPGTARNYISSLKKESEESWRQLTTLLDNDKDSRNGIIRNHVALAKDHTSTARASKGNPDRPVRGGAPQDTKSGRPRSTTKGSGIPADALFDLRKFQKKYGLTSAQLTETAKKLEALVEDC